MAPAPLPDVRFGAQVLRMSRLIGVQADQLLKDLLPVATKEEQEVLRRVLRLIEEHASYAKESAKTIVDAARAARGASKTSGR